MKKEQPIFVAIFEDNTKFIGGFNYFETKWLELPLKKKIKKLFYLLPSGDYLTLSGEKYFHMIEVLQDLNGKERGQVRFQYAYIMAKRKDKVISYRITLHNTETDRYKFGDITQREFNINDEKIKKLNSDNWR